MSYAQKLLISGVIAMAFIVVISNYLVNIPIDYVISIANINIDLNNWLTYGALSYPLAFLITDTTNRYLGAAKARKVVYVGFVIGVALSLLVDIRIAIASGTAFLIAQLCDVYIFDRLRHVKQWWLAPLSSSFITSAIDTALFFSIAFIGTGLPWLGWATGDFAAKISVAFLALIPYRVIISLLKPTQATAINAS